MNGANTESAEFDFEFGTASTPPLAAARSWLRGLLWRLTAGTRQDVELVATELLTNAYEHATGPFGLRLLCPRGQPLVRLEVDDACPHLLPRSRGVAPNHRRGRGLLMVKAISSKWGLRLLADRKTIWAEIPIIPDG
jgi:anti-sigma regulatory factor (Ser/Thr protein kinase)